MSHHASWLETLVDPKLLNKRADFLIGELEKDKKLYEINALVVRGISGAVMGGIVSSITGIPLVIVRKEKSHSGYDVEYDDYLLDEEKPTNYVIIDDLINSGDTMKEIVKAIKSKTHFEKANLKKIYLYSFEYYNGCSSPDSHWNDIPVCYPEGIEICD
jgi:adenine/guanine phosphoribosyltransferase-like PRPP-binding protein